MPERAARLHEAGVRGGNIVALILPDSADHLITLFALARVGAKIFSLPVFVSRRDIEQSLASLSIDAVIAPCAHIAPDGSVSDKAKRPRPYGQGLLNIPAEDLYRPGASPVDVPEFGDDAPLMLSQSSGTTGAPKSFFRSHAAMAEWLRCYSRAQNWSRDDRCLSLNHMSFDIGRTVSMGMLHMGATVVVNHANTLDALVAFIHEKTISYVKLAPSHLKLLLGYHSGETPLFPDVRAMVVGSAPTTQEERLRARQLLTPNFYEQLGTNETGLLVMSSPADQDARPESLGRVVEGVEAQIVDGDGVILSAGEVGHVRYRGAGFTSRYLDNPVADESAFREGWFYPGDLAAIDGEGYFYLKGRADDVINNGGAKFYPIELEIILNSHPGVSEAAVLGWPHQHYGETAVAFVVRNLESLESKELMAYCGEHISAHKLPRMILFMPDLPKNPMGKIAKDRLRKQLAEKLKETRRSNTTDGKG